MRKIVKGGCGRKTGLCMGEKTLRFAFIGRETFEDSS
jgi:hypothetical protein